MPSWNISRISRRFRCALSTESIVPRTKASSIEWPAVLYYIRAPVFPRVCDYRIHLVVRAISSILKLLEFLRCHAPVSPTLAWWQRLLTHVLRGPENRLADPSNDESSYPLVDWGNSLSYYMARIIIIIFPLTVDMINEKVRRVVEYKRIQSAIKHNDLPNVYPKYR